MAERRVGIVAECICDLPRRYLREHGVEVIYFLVRTDSGVFTDTDEITAENVLGYMESGGSMPVSSPPSEDTYERIFREALGRYGEIIFISTGEGASASRGKAEKAAANMGDDGKNVHIFDSKHLSTGLGHIVTSAVEMAEEGRSAEEILSALADLRERVSTSFITVNADYLYRNGRVPLSVKKLCDLFGIHPVLMMKDGRITLKSVMLGNYERASLRYVRRELRNADRIDKKRIFITHAGCGAKMIERIKAEAGRRCPAKEITVTKASATISCNCGPGTFGVLYVREK